MTLENKVTGSSLTFLGLFALGEVSCHIERTLSSLRSSCGKDRRSLASSLVKETSWKLILQSQSNLQMTVATADILTATE